MGGALIEGWLATGAFAAADLIIVDPAPGGAALTAVAQGARLNPPDATLAEAKTVVLAVRPQIWREAAAAIAPKLAAEAVVVSVAAGVKLKDLAAQFAPRSVARTMPTTAVAIGKGTISITGPAAIVADRLFGPVALATAYLPLEAEMDAAVAISGSAPAYLYALMEALAAAGAAEGLPLEIAAHLAQATLIGAAALMENSGEDAAQLRRKVASPGGTTEAALNVLMADDGLGPLLARTVAAAAKRSRELG
jgi:pyrroline-5-carboxylate reductase